MCWGGIKCTTPGRTHVTHKRFQVEVARQMCLQIALLDRLEVAVRAAVFVVVHVRLHVAVQSLLAQVGASAEFAQVMSLEAHLTHLLTMRARQAVLLQGGCGHEDLWKSSGRISITRSTGRKTMILPTLWHCLHSPALASAAWFCCRCCRKAA